MRLSAAIAVKSEDKSNYNNKNLDASDYYTAVDI